MPTPTLLYHDVVPDEDWSSSGFPGSGPDAYKLTAEEFDRHLDRLEALRARPSLVGRDEADGGWRITFDDGGSSALDVIAPALEQRGWRGHFFMTTGWLDRPGFLSSDGVREMVARGHVIGSHSVSHPVFMSACSREQLEREWRESVETLADVLGFRPETASIPGGGYSRTVAETAALAGIRYLFTSEPNSRVWEVDGVTCYGRYTLRRGHSPEAALACARGRGIWPLQQRVVWNTKKTVKTVLGPGFRAFRGRMIQHSAAE